MSMLNADDLLKEERTLEFTRTRRDWARISAGIRITMSLMEEKEAEKGPMPPNVRANYEALSHFVSEIAFKMELEEIVGPPES